MKTCIKCGKSEENLWLSKSGYCEECAKQILNQRQVKPPFYTKWWIWAIAAVFLIGLIIPKERSLEDLSAPDQYTAAAAGSLDSALALQSTDTSAPAPTPTPTPTPVPFEPISLSGNGDDVKTTELPTGVYVMSVDYDGDSNFSIWTHSDGSEDLTVNTIGNYCGTHMLLGGNTIFEVTASGSWTIEIDPAPMLSTINASGHGDACPGLYYASSRDTGVYELTHNGDSNFAVWMYTTNQTELLANEIGSYQGKKLIELEEGEILLFDITADGDWSITRVD